MIAAQREMADRGLTLHERREFMKLSVEQRRRQMAEQAAELIAHYEAAVEVARRQEWQGGDIVEVT